MVQGHCYMPEAQVAEAFLASPPLISQTMLDLSAKYPNWMRDAWDMELWPLGHGTQMEQLVIRQAYPQIERGFDKWKKLGNNTGCNPCAGPDCSYNISQFGGFGIERKVVDLMRREFVSPSYCISEIQTTYQFDTLFPKVVEFLYRQVEFFKEFNIGQNVLTSLAKKYVIDSSGPKPNIQNPYVYPPLGTAILSTLTVDVFSFFYERMRRLASAIPYDQVDGAPLFAAIMSPELLSRLYRDDPQIRQDVRFSSEANGLLSKYNFITSIRNMFLPAVTMYPRRFSATAGVLTEILPYLNNVPMEAGVYTEVNPAYESAQYEEVILHGMHPFKLMYLESAQTLGANSSFGPEVSFFNIWQWINPQTVEDPLRRVGFFMTEASIGIAPQYSEAIFAILVNRQNPGIMYAPPLTVPCPEPPVVCDNVIPAVGCPCGNIVSITPNPVTPGNYFVTLSVATTAVPTDVLQLGYATGGYVNATVVAVSADGLSVEVTIAEDLPLPCDNFTTLFCDDTLGCSSSVLEYSIDPADNNNLFLTLSYPIKAVTAADVVTLTFGNGTQDTTVTVVSADMVNNAWVVDTGGVFVDNVGGVVSICVPTATDASCPGCDVDPTFTPCDVP